MNQSYHFETRQLHGGGDAQPSGESRAVPIHQTASYHFDGFDHAQARFNLSDPGNIYGRLTNPTQGAFEARIAHLEGGVGALALASGAAALTYTFLNLAHGGDHLVSAKTLYGGSYHLLAQTLPNYGIETSFVDIEDLQQVEAAIGPNTKGIFVESLSNPHSHVADLEGLSAIAHRHGIPLVVDNTFATPYLLRPIEYGADLVVHSATKYIGGHGSTLGGVIIDGGTFDWAESGKFPHLTQPDESYHGLSFTQACGQLAFLVYTRAILLRDTGATIAPLNAFLLLQGLETLSLRVERHVENGLKVVEFLKNHPKVAAVHHPSISQDTQQQTLYQKYFPRGGGAIFSVELVGTKGEAKAFIDGLNLFSLVANVADVKSLVIHPATTTHAQLSAQTLAEQGITETTVRLSIGTEHIDDILGDLSQALDGI